MKANGLRLQPALGCFAAVALVLSLPTRATAAEPENPGKAAYVRYCSSCHGVDAKGDGPLAGMLTRKPTDLTQIARNANGQYPRQRIGQAIDGTTLVPGHGEVDMPVWGECLGKGSMRHNVLLIEDYIRSIQAK